MKKCLLSLIVVVLNISITQAQNQGYQWSFGAVPPVASSPAIQGSAGSYPLTTLGGAADIPVVTTHAILSKSPGLGASCTGPIAVDSIDAPSGLEFSNAPQFVSNTWTIEMAVNFATPPGDYRKIFGFDDLSTPDGDKGIYLEALTQKIFYWDGAAGVEITGGAITSGTWNYLVFTRDDATDVVSYYLNGALIGNYDDAANVFVPKAANSFKINFFKDDGTEESDVEIAKLGIYNRTLTASEILKRTFENICNTTHLLAPNPNEGHQWTFASAPFVSTPAVAASTGTYTLGNIGAAITTGTTEDPDLGASCLVPVVAAPIGAYPLASGLEFDNSPRYIYDTYTIEMAVNIATLGANFVRLVGFNDLGTPPFSDYGIYVNLAGHVEFVSATSTAIAAAPLTTNVWYHLVFVRDAAGLISYYQNGALVGTYSDAVADEFVPKGPNGNIITLLKDDIGDESSGKLVKVGIFNTPLSLSDVQERYNNVCNAALVVLPVSLKSFTAVKADKQVELTWTTALEENNLGFEVQRSKDGITYTTIGFVKGSGTSSQENTYHFTDPSPLAGNNYYRLKQIDITNFATFSTIRRIDMDKLRQDIHLFPNPARGMITITNIKAGDHLSVFNSYGNLVIRKIASSGQESLSVEKFAAGVYMLQVTDKDNSNRIIRFTKF